MKHDGAGVGVIKKAMPSFHCPPGTAKILMSQGRNAMCTGKSSLDRSASEAGMHPTVKCVTCRKSLGERT